MVLKFFWFCIAEWEYKFTFVNLYSRSRWVAVPGLFGKTKIRNNSKVYEKIGFKIREEYFEPVTMASVNKFLNFGIEEME